MILIMMRAGFFVFHGSSVSPTICLEDVQVYVTSRSCRRRWAIAAVRCPVSVLEAAPWLEGWNPVYYEYIFPFSTQLLC